MGSCKTCKHRKWFFGFYCEYFERDSILVLLGGCDGYYDHKLAFVKKENKDGNVD